MTSVWFLLCSMVASVAWCYVDDSQLPFEFITEPLDVETHLGSRVVLPCKIQNPSFGVQWTQDTFGLGPDRDLQHWHRYRIIGNDPKRDWNLEIRKVELDDDAVYQCQHLRARSRSAKVTVLVPPENPFIIGGPRLDVIENRNVTLTCVSEGGKPAALISWYDENGDLINNASYQSERMSDNPKLFVAKSSISLIPSKARHNATYKCEAWNNVSSTRPAFVRLRVKYAPSVTVMPVRRSMPIQGEKAGFQCLAEANPPPFADKYRWYFDDTLIEGQVGYYYEIQNVTKAYHNHQIKCSVQNELGIASGIRTIEVQYPPLFVRVPSNAAGNEMESVTLKCEADSNPTAKYYWTKGTYNERVSEEQYLVIQVTPETIGDYYCHAQVAEFPPITSRAAEVLLNGPPRILSSQVQYAVPGEDAHLNCASASVPKPNHVEWMFHDSVLDESNNHYRIINSPMQRGYRSTLIILRSLSTDFGVYTCRVKNDFGTSEMEIELEEERPFPLMVAMVGAFTFVILVLVTTIFAILCRRKLKRDSKELKNGGASHSGTNTQVATAMNNMIKNNNLDQLSNSSNLKGDMETPSFSNEADSAWEGSDNQDGIYGRAATLGASSSQLLRDMDPDFPPKPDVVSNGYVPYGNYVREFNPPFTAQQDTSPIYGSAAVVSPMMGASSNDLGSSNGLLSHRSSLNVSDPRYSATYGNPYLRMSGQTCQYSTFLPPPPRTASAEGSGLNVSNPLLQMPSSANHFGVHPGTPPLSLANGGLSSGLYGTVSIHHHQPQPTSIGRSSLSNSCQGDMCMSTPNSSVNMSSLPEETPEVTPMALVSHSSVLASSATPPMTSESALANGHIINNQSFNGIRSNYPNNNGSSLATRV